MPISRQNRASAFTLIELLVVLAIVSLLSALLFPVFATVRGKAREVSCLSNLRQIGQSLNLYLQDYDGFYPHAVDPSDRAQPSRFAKYVDFAANIPSIGLLHDVMQPYLKSKQIFACPADTGFKNADFSGVFLDAYPSSYEKYGTSYYYRTALAARRINDASLIFPGETNLLFDGVGYWHGTLLPITSRYNVLFTDGHVKNVIRAQIDQAWSTPLTDQG